MRTNRFLVFLMLLALLAAPVALAERGDRAAKAQDARDDDRDDNETRDDHSGRRWGAGADANESANRTARLDGFLEQVKAFHVAWKENATQIREDCHAAADLAENATKEQRKERSHCIKDGYAAWRAEHRADLKALRAEFKELMGSWGKSHRRDG